MISYRKPMREPVSPSRWLLSCAIALILISPFARTSAAVKQKPRAALIVQDILSAEAQGKASPRDQSLARIIEAEPDFAPARWAAGYVQRDGEWVKFDAIAGGSDEAIAEYRRLRGSVSDTAEGHVRIAKWCHSRGLPDERRAHLRRAFDLEPDRADIREMLKMVQVGGVWMLPGEARQAVVRGKQAAADLKYWLPKIERFRSALSGPPGRHREMAARHVRAIKDTRAIVALETVLAPANDEAAVAVVDALAAMKRPEAALALARLAAFSESLDATDAARAKLKTFSLYCFVPAMLSSLVVPGVVQTRIVPGRFGRLLFHQSIVYEGSDRKVAAVFDNVYRIPNTGYGLASDASLAVNAVGSVTFAARGYVVDARNRQVEHANHRIMEALRAITGRKLADDPRAWWGWWDALNEISPGSKPTDLLYVSLEQVMPSREALLNPPASCLIAGTPIWTDHGPIAVEQMRIGDRVLAQDVVTGELAYKPVLRTTIRRRAPLFHVALPGETLVASGGHPVWIADRGWVSVSQLKVGMTVHTVTSALTIAEVKEEKDADQPVFNLVVEDFHNYFAGKSHSLMHDNTIREPTIGPVPGWMENVGSGTPSK